MSTCLCLKSHLFYASGECDETAHDLHSRGLYNTLKWRSHSLGDSDQLTGVPESSYFFSTRMFSILSQLCFLQENHKAACAHFFSHPTQRECASREREDTAIIALFLEITWSLSLGGWGLISETSAHIFHQRTLSEAPNLRPPAHLYH